MAIQVKYFPTNEPFNNWSYHSDTTGRPEWRKDSRRGMTENFTFDNLERLKTYQNGSVSYDVKGNITLKSDAGNLYYNDPAKPYSITSQSNSPLPVRVQNISYTSFQRPLAIEENGCRADFVYGPGHNRVNMKLKTSPTTEFLRYYVAGCYEKDVNTLGTPGTTERLYIGGDAYSAPAVYIRANSGAWQLHYLHRDVQGSITNITNSSGTEVAEYSYTAWGRMRNPVNWTAYAPGTEPALLTGRGYTGHEHLNMFRLINMNARLYDPVLSRMLSPDNYVQSPDFSQNFNRYAYCLNNPVMYADPSGDFWQIAVFAAFMYFKTAHDNKDKETGQWAWNPLSWFKNDNFRMEVGVNVSTDLSKGNAYIGAGTGTFIPGVSYDNQSGFGFGYVSQYGNNAFFYPSQNHNTPKQITNNAITEARANAASGGGITVPYILGGMENSAQALSHYLNGNGAPATLGNNTINALVLSDGFQSRHQRIISGKTTSLTGSFSVNLTGNVFHLGRTNVDYSINCASGNCTVTYDMFVRDGFWDPDCVDEYFMGRLFGEPLFQPDGPGPNLERLGGTPYPYNPIRGTYTFPNPGY